jgi:hypothetical protein
MTTAAMRTQLIAYLSDADDNKIKGLYSLLEDNIHEKAALGLTGEQLRFLNEEHRKHISGESKSYTWNEIKSKIKSKRHLSV